MAMIETSCNCGEKLLVETGLEGVCRADGKRPHYRESGPRVTQFRCRQCGGWLADTCHDAAFGPRVTVAANAKLRPQAGRFPPVAP